MVSIDKIDVVSARGMPHNFHIQLEASVGGGMYLRDRVSETQITKEEKINSS